MNEIIALQLSSDEDCNRCITLESLIEIIDVETQKTVFEGKFFGYNDDYFFVSDAQYSRDRRKNVAYANLLCGL